MGLTRFRIMGLTRFRINSKEIDNVRFDFVTTDYSHIGMALPIHSNQTHSTPSNGSTNNPDPVGMVITSSFLIVLGVVVRFFRSKKSGL